MKTENTEKDKTIKTKECKHCGTTCECYIYTMCTC
uniref:Uncharacterized protein n=1 Tax=Megaviridae environmental sample TaxID=1737588 RepID=A0A5J6VKX9_9VIRU|nr:MAG: hypothetical protein [Megaviridae environmental sample]